MGPAQMYLSKAPGALEDYEGDGEWFKIGSMGSRDGVQWDTYMKNEVSLSLVRTVSLCGASKG